MHMQFLLLLNLSLNLSYIFCCIWLIALVVFDLPLYQSAQTNVKRPPALQKRRLPYFAL